MEMICSVCSVPLSRSVHQRVARGETVSGMCGKCYHDAIRIARHCSLCGDKITHRAKQGRCRPCANRQMAADQERERDRIERARKAFYQPAARARHNAANRRVGDRKLGWCPEERRGEYLKLLKRMPAVEAREVIISRLTPFERQLARVLQGARVVEKVVIPQRAQERSLIGNCWGEF